MAELLGTDSVEFAVKDLGAADRWARGWGFTKLADGNTKAGRSALYAQGNARLVFNQPNDDKSRAGQWLKKHKEGIFAVNFGTTSVEDTLQQAAKAGAQVFHKAVKEEVEDGAITHGAMYAFADVIYGFVERHGTKRFSTEFESATTDQNPKGFGIKGVDHLTNNVNMGEMEPLAEFYEKALGMVCTRHFTITTGRTGLLSKVMQTPDGAVKVPLNEPTEPESQVQEFNDLNNGPGVQHLAYLTGDICETLIALREKGRQKFLSVPDTYYEAVPTRVPNVKEDMKRLQKLGVLLDGDNKGYILQIFSENVVGPFFYEVIQRRGNDGFGEGNFKALFEAIERDQIHRGVLKAK